MSGDEAKKTNEGQGEEPPAAPSCSGSEVPVLHDPVADRLIMQLSRCTEEYLDTEIVAGPDDYIVLEDITRLSYTKYADLRDFALKLLRTLNDPHGIYKQRIMALLQQIEVIHSQVSRFELNVFRLESYTRRLQAQYKEFDEY